ncbi:MAG: prephenate dehydrogenase dimerization domain-containing protein, partial [Thermomicrobiales bacterium]
DVSRLAAGSPEMYRDICQTNRESLLRWIDEFSASLQNFRGLLASEDPAQATALQAYFTQARDARADWATAERTDGGILQDTEGELSKSSLGGQVGQMLFGGLVRRRPPLPNGNGAGEKGRQERPDRS